MVAEVPVRGKPDASARSRLFRNWKPEASARNALFCFLAYEEISWFAGLRTVLDKFESAINQKTDQILIR